MRDNNKIYFNNLIAIIFMFMYERNVLILVSFFFP